MTGEWVNEGGRDWVSRYLRMNLRRLVEKLTMYTLTHIQSWKVYTSVNKIGWWILNKMIHLTNL